MFRLYPLYLVTLVVALVLWKGRRFAGWLDTWFGPDTLSAPQESPEGVAAGPGVRIGHP